MESQPRGLSFITDLYLNLQFRMNSPLQLEAKFLFKQNLVAKFDLTDKNSTARLFHGRDFSRPSPTERSVQTSMDDPSPSPYLAATMRPNFCRSRRPFSRILRFKQSLG